MIDALLIINAGSSSIKFAVYQVEQLTCLARGQVSSIHSLNALKFNVTLTNEATQSLAIEGIKNHQQALNAILKWVDDPNLGWHIKAAGHRVVHGGAKRHEPVVVNAKIMDELHALAPLAPLHQLHNLAAIKCIAQTHGDLPQVACFDTAFHASQSDVQRLLPLPKKYRDKGLMRYGFHGLSYDYLITELRQIYNDQLPTNIVIAHLGNGASACAVKQGKSVASSMSFSTLDGLLMGSRCGSIDAGAILYLLQSEGLSIEQLSHCLYEESGLLGLSGISSDVRELESSSSESAQLALEYYIDAIVKTIASLAATLQGIDALVFSGGVGENSIWIREEVLKKLSWLGIDIDINANNRQQTFITTKQSKVHALIIKTDEELVIARQTKLKCHLN